MDNLLKQMKTFDELREAEVSNRKPKINVLVRTSTYFEYLDENETRLMHSQL